MKLDELTFEIRDASLNRVGLLLPADLVGWSSVMRFNNVGSWSITLQADLPMGLLLSVPGAGILVTHATAGVILSGPTVSVETVSNSGDPKGLVTVSGVDDSVILGERLCYPTPSTADVGAQTSAHDKVSDVRASTAMYGYVARNMLPGVTPAVREVSTLAFAVDEGLGGLISKSARFDILGELLADIAVVDGLGFEVRQNDLALEFKVFEPVDRTGEIRMDVANNTLSSVSYGYGVHGASHVVVAGQGDLTERQFVELTTSESLAAQTQWGRRIEVFKDERNTDVVAELEQAGLEILAESGLTITSVDVMPSSDETMQPFTTWNLGDLVTVVVGGQEVSAVVSAMALTVSADGVRVAATVGQPEGISYEALLARKAASNAKRVNALDRKESAAGGSPGTAGPAGSIMAWAATTPPANWLICDGSAVSRTSYASLFNVIATNFGVGDGSSTFNLPDLRGRVPVGKDAGTFGALAGSGGAETHLLTAAESGLPSHTHSLPMGAGGAPNGVNDQPLRSSGSTDSSFRTSTPKVSAAYGSANAPSSASSAHNNVQPYLVLNYIIKTTVGETPGDSELATRVGVSEADITTLETQAATTNKSGLVPVVPPTFATSGGTSSRSGATVTFENASIVSLNDVFSSDYDSYRIIFIQQSASAVSDLYLRLRRNGGDRAASYYGNGTLVTGSSVSGVNLVNQSYWLFSATHSGTGNSHAASTFDIMQPYFSKPTTLQSKGSSWTNSTNRSFNMAGFHAQTNFQDGFTIFPASGTIGGTVTVYGYNS